MDYDIVIPLFSLSWNTRCVFEALRVHYNPRRIILVTPENNLDALNAALKSWDLQDIESIPEEPFFQKAHGLSKQELAKEISTEGSLYTAGWYFQQLLKLGASEGIPELSDPYLVWDSDLLLIDPWPAVIEKESTTQFATALLQHNSKGNSKIVSAWASWIHQILEIEPAQDESATFIPHHMWFHKQFVSEITQKLQEYYQSEHPWPKLMMRSGAEFTTFSEFWLYSSWVKAFHADTYVFHPYEIYGATTERFFDNGHAPFSNKLRASRAVKTTDPFFPSFQEVMSFIHEEYEGVYPSSLSFEANERHLKKGDANRHLEETRSRWI